MLLTITSTTPDATDLGYLLHKHPDRVQTFDLPTGRAHVGYPEATPERCTVALVLDIEPFELSRRRGRGRSLYDYVNDRAYVASSFLSVAINKVFRSALKGRCDARPELVDEPLALTATIASVPCDEGAALIRDLFEPLGYDVGVETGPLDERFPSWGPSDQFTVTLTAQVPLRLLLAHLYVLLPVLDGAKHYWVDEEEVDKLLRFGDEWLATHPARETISHRYLKRRGHLSRAAMARLADEGGAPADADGSDDLRAPARPRLRDQRLDAVAAQLLASGVSSVADLGCGEGALLQRLVPEVRLTRLVGADVSIRSLQRAKDRLHLDRLPLHRQEQVELLQSSVLYVDHRLDGVDAVALVEVIEHLDPWRLPALEANVFGVIAPALAVVTTPNAEHNVRYEGLAPGAMRHDDHRFEWTRAEFRAWAERVADEHGYEVEVLPIGEDDPEVGPPTQLAVLRRGVTAEVTT